MITEIKDTILESYQVRKGKKKKTAFIEYVQNLCNENGIRCTVEEKGSNRNIVMGASPEECEMIVGGHYDTCAVMPLPNFITPKNGLLFVLYQILLTAVMLALSAGLGVLAGFIFSLFFPGSEFTVPLGALVSYVVLIILCILMIAGPANKHTANDNTSGTVAVLNTLLTMSPEQRAKVCFVLFDNEEVGLLGSSAFASMHKDAKKNIPMVNLDCVSDGDYLFCRLPGCHKKNDFFARYTEAMTRSAEKHGVTPVIGASGFYPSDQANFKQGIGVAFLNKAKLVGLYMDKIHTKHDTVFTDRNIDCLTEGLIELVSGETAE